MFVMMDIKQGDCIELMKTIPNDSVDLILTDPPYNMDNFDNIETKETIIKRNFDFDRKVINIEILMTEFERILKDGGTFLIFCSPKQLGKYINYCEKSKTFRYSNTLVWADKMGHPSIRKRAFSNTSQYIIFGHKEIKEKYTFNWLGEPKMRTVLSFNGCTSFEYGKAKTGSVGESVGHPTQKPTKLIEHLIKICSNEGNIILDPFMGSGTTGIACKHLGRDFIGYEILIYQFMRMILIIRIRISIIRIISTIRILVSFISILISREFLCSHIVRIEHIRNYRKHAAHHRGRAGDVAN